MGRSEAGKTTRREAIAYSVSLAFMAAFCYSTMRLVPSLPEAYWAPIAGLVVLYPAGDATKKAAFQYFAGTVIGCVVGWGCSVWWHENVAIYALGVVVGVALCYLLRLESAARLCSVAITVITLIPHDASPHVVAFHRFVEVSYGVACALAYTVIADAVRERRRRRAPD